MGSQPHAFGRSHIKKEDASRMGVGFDSPCVWAYSRGVETPHDAGGLVEPNLGRSIECCFFLSGFGNRANLPDFVH